MALSSRERRRRYVAKKLGQLNSEPPHLCPCGCGTLVPAFNARFERRIYARGHSPEAKAAHEKLKRAMTGKPFSAEHKQKLSQALKGKVKSPEAINNRRESILRNGSYKGERNPFYGKQHSPETRQKIAAKSSTRTQEKNPNWKGGVDKLPYGPEFTDKFKALIRQRDGHRCQRCGRTRRQEGKALSVHHIDHDKMNNDPTNLITVCGSCNTWLSYHRDNSILAFPCRKMLLT